MHTYAGVSQQHCDNDNLSKTLQSAEQSVSASQTVAAITVAALQRTSSDDSNDHLFWQKAELDNPTQDVQYP